LSTMPSKLTTSSAPQAPGPVIRGNGCIKTKSGVSRFWQTEEAEAVLGAGSSALRAVMLSPKGTASSKARNGFIPNQRIRVEKARKRPSVCPFGRIADRATAKGLIQGHEHDPIIAFPAERGPAHGSRAEALFPRTAAAPPANGAQAHRADGRLRKHERQISAISLSI
jgi:hypothetical protein